MQLLQKKQGKIEQNIHYKLGQWRKMGTFDILNNISEYVTLVQLIDSLGNINHAVGVFENLIFDSNDEKYLPSNIDSLNLICDFSDEED